MSHTWQSIGPAKVELTATDQHGHSATTVFVVNVGNVAPSAFALHENATTVGTEVTLQGCGERRRQADDDLNVAINFGDGAQKSTKVGPNSMPLFDPAITGSARIRGALDILTTHTYTEPGIYYGHSRCPTGAVAPTSTPSSSGSPARRRSPSPRLTTTSTATSRPWPRQVRRRGAGDLHGRPAGSVRGERRNGTAVTIVGVGECTVTSHQAEYLPSSSPRRRWSEPSTSTPLR